MARFQLTKSRPRSSIVDWHGIFFNKKHFTDAVILYRCCAVSLHNRGTMFYERFTRVLAATIREPDPWPTLHFDVVKPVQQCDQCKRFSLISKLLDEPLAQMVSPWPFPP
ncbi:unnamed protein product [Prunus armeniaca]